MGNAEEQQKAVDELLSRSIDSVLPSKEKLEEALKSGKKLRIYIGADATGPALHLGHATNYMVLERFRRLGHKVIILIGDFTAMIGDPTDKLAARQRLTREQVEENVRTWLDQIRPLLGFQDAANPPEVVYNSTWLGKLRLPEVTEIASHFTVQRMMERDMFQKRLREKKPIWLHEFFYPLMQGYDSVALDVDVELCGTDQTFNALAGRNLQRDYHNKEKFVVTTTLLENPITKEKMMSKSLGTGVYLNESAESMREKILKQADENIPQLFTDCTYVSLEEIAQVREDLMQHPEMATSYKERLADEIIKIYHSD
jgi:tyrosyl-tRNA synthetase